MLIGLRNLFADGFEPIQDAAFGMAEIEENGVDIFTGRRLHFLAHLGHEIVAHFAEGDGIVHPFAHVPLELRGAEKLVPAFGEGFQEPIANLAHELRGRRIGGKREGRLHQLGDGFKPDFLKGRALFGKFLCLFVHK
ncbi:MAG TPA: hypothetical protein VF988_12245 [Verrucomicrobiae bacterium]